MTQEDTQVSRIVLTALVAGTALAGLATPGMAEPRKLRIADSFPAGHYLVRLIIQPWMAEVTKRSNGEITFEYFPSQQLGKAADMLTLTQTEIADIGYVAPAYVSDKMVASEVAMLPGGFTTACQGTRAYLETARNGLVAAQDYTPNKIKLLLAVALPPYQILTVKAPVASEQDVKGLKLRSTGGAQDLTLRSVGAVPVRMAAPETYESLSRGTLDGVLFPLDSVVSYNVEKLVRYSTEGENFGSFVVAYSISDRAWNKLPPEARKIMVDVADETNKAACAAVDKQEAETKQKLQAAGVKFAPLPGPMKADVAGKLADVGAQWAKGLDTRGKKGSEVLKEFVGLLKQQSGG
jgi:TRAP-type C4-dicarboxylate transport system substrate-binding protein